MDFLFNSQGPRQERIFYAGDAVFFRLFEGLRKLYMFGLPFVKRRQADTDVVGDFIISPSLAAHRLNNHHVFRRVEFSPGHSAALLSFYFARAIWARIIFI